MRSRLTASRRRAIIVLDRLGLKPIVQRLVFGGTYLLDHRTRASNARLRRIGAPDGHPLPAPRDAQVISGRSFDLQGYLDSGALNAASMREILARRNLDLTALTPMLDFGCGVARLARRMPLNSIDLHGVDFNPRMIAWCRTSFPNATFRTCGASPPLPYDDEAFAFVYAVGVFPCLDEQRSASWRDELARVLRPGGILYLTLQGEGYLSAPNDRGGINADDLAADEGAVIASGGIVVRGARFGADSDSPDQYFACQVIHSNRFIRERLAGSLRLLDIIPAGALDSQHDVVLLQKR